MTNNAWSAFLLAFATAIGAMWGFSLGKGDLLVFSLAAGLTAMWLILYWYITPIIKPVLDTPK